MRTLNGWGVGRFSLTGHAAMAANPRFLLLMFSGVVPVHIETNWATDEIKYMAYSPLFDVVPEGQIVPEYEFWFDSRSGAVTVSRVDEDTP